MHSFSFNFFRKLTKNNFFYMFLGNLNSIFVENVFYSFFSFSMKLNYRVSYKIKIKSFFEKFHDIMLSNLLTIIKTSFSEFKFSKLNSIFISRLNRFIKYNFSVLARKTKKSLKSKSKSIARYLSIDRVGNVILGFKIHLIGRFTRKQRVASL